MIRQIELSSGGIVQVVGEASQPLLIDVFSGIGVSPLVPRIPGHSFVSLDASEAQELIVCIGRAIEAAA
jgi:hypothetical protein